MPVRQTGQRVMRGLVLKQGVLLASQRSVARLCPCQDEQQQADHQTGTRDIRRCVDVAALQCVGIGLYGEPPMAIGDIQSTDAVHGAASKLAQQRAAVDRQ